MQVKRIISIIITALAVMMVTFSGIMKLSGNADMVDGLTKVGVGNYIFYLGLMEIAFAALFAFPKTMKLGFLLLSCYFAGALATELSHGTGLNALLPMVLIWVSAFLRDRSIFLPAPMVAAA